MTPARFRSMLRVLPLLALLPAARAAAQTVQGQVVEGAAATPVAGSLVVLLDAEGRTRGSVLTDAGGRFTLAAPGAGRYRVRADRVGHPSTLSDALELAAGDTRQLRLAADSRGVSLEAITVSAASKQCARAGANLATATLWEEARKALASADVASRGSAYRFDVAQYVRSMEPGSLRVRYEQRRTDSGTALRPFQSLPPDSLSRFGYLKEQPDGTLYYGPDVRVLSSPQFVDEHCFHVADAASEAGLVGLAFEPARDRKLPDIAGTMWLDRATAELRYVEYRYANLDTHVPVQALGGRVEFEREPDGGWIVRRWRIRTPELAVTRRVDAMAVNRAVAGTRVETLTGIHENGGEVTRISTPDGRPVGTSTLAAITGTLKDGATGAPVAGARVFVSGTQFAAVTDAHGAFRIDGLGEGSYALAYVHPRLDSLGSFPAPATVAVKPGEVAQVALELPPPPTRVAQAGASRPAARAPAPGASGSAEQPIPLGRVAATARPQSLGINDFYARVRHGNGFYLTRADIDRLHVSRTIDLFRGVPEVSLTGGGNLLRMRNRGSNLPSGAAAVHNGISPQRAAVMSHEDLQSESAAQDRANGGHGGVESRPGDCVPIYYVDGARWPGADLDLGQVPPQDIEGIEVYSSVSEAPPQFRSLNTECGIIVVWTKVAGAGSDAGVPDPHAAGQRQHQAAAPASAPADTTRGAARPSSSTPSTASPTSAGPGPVAAGRAVPLDTVAATGRGGARSEFYQRAGHGQGVYITRDQIERSHASRTTDLLRSVQSLEVVGGTVRPRAAGNQAPRGAAAFALNAENPSERSKPDCRPQAGGATRQQAQAACEEARSATVEADCQPALFVDGQPAPGGVADINSIAPAQIEGIEVYARAATAPAQYKRLNSDCSIILVWTRQQPTAP